MARQVDDMKCLANDRTAKALENKARKQSIEFFSVLFAYVLADKYGFGKQKLHQVLKTVIKLAEEIADDDIKLEELKEVLNEEYDVIFK